MISNKVLLENSPFAVDLEGDCGALVEAMAQTGSIRANRRPEGLAGACRKHRYSRYHGSAPLDISEACVLRLDRPGGLY